MFCMNCGGRLKPEDRFCAVCGTAVRGPDAGAAATVVAARRRHRAVIGTAAALVVLVLAALGALVTYGIGLWGGVRIPDPAVVARRSGVDVTELTADDMAAYLKDHGVVVDRGTVFSSQPDKGLFKGYDGVEAGDRVNEGETVRILEAAGPGMPGDVIGKRAAKVDATLRAMGVKVRYKQVAVDGSGSSDVKDGTIVATEPAAGMPLDDPDDGMTVGVAVTGANVDGLPIDTLGRDVDDVRDELGARGHPVRVEYRFSSRRYVGKVSGSDPVPGSELAAGQSVILYQGVDASSTRAMMSELVDFGNGRDAAVVKTDLSFLAGRYCRSSVADPATDCVTLSLSPQDSWAGSGDALHIEGHDVTGVYDALGLMNFSHDIGGLLLDTGDSSDEDGLPLKNNLIRKDWGMFELYSGMDMPDCGDRTVPWSEEGACADGMTYRMKDFLVYFPVGSDIAALEDSGYFDADALAKAKTQDPVDADRPFILLRDPDLYDETSVSVDDVDADPFVPTNVDGANAMVPMKPAPSDGTVYYLVESPDPDWDSLPDYRW